MKRNRFLNTFIIFAFYVALTFFFSSGKIFYYMVKGAPFEMWTEVKMNAWRWIPWAFFTPFIIRLVRRFRFEDGNWKYTVPLHLIISLLFSFIQSFILLLNDWIYSLSWNLNVEIVLMYFVQMLPLNIIAYWVIVGVFYSIDYYKKARERELRTSKLENQLSQAQLQVLKMQMNPHFLFNTLHAISALVFKNPKAADKMISLLSDLLRISLEKAGFQEVPLKEELDFLHIYLQIEKTRFQDRLIVNMDIDPDTLDAMVPNLILQPLVENAIRHGIGPLKQGGTINVHSARHLDRLILTIDDNGKGLEEKPANNKRNGNGIGLTNTKERLKQLYGANHKFTLRNGEKGGALVQLEIPFRLYVEPDQESDQGD